jgi:hypothetical protein
MIESAFQRLPQARRSLANGCHGADPGTIDLCIGAFGLGVVALRPIAAGEVVLRLGGPLISYQEAVAKGVWQSYPLQVGADQYIDLVEPGCYLNHSCDPNIGIIQLNVIALRSIAAQDELRFDYSTTMDEDDWEMTCCCGSETCRGRVTDFRHLPPAVRQRYLDLAIVQPFIARQYDGAAARVPDQRR